MSDSTPELGLELVTAAAVGMTDLAESAITRGADVHHDNDLPLRTAALMGNNDMVRFLVEKKGANVQAEHNQTLLYAARRQDEATVEFLLSKGADIGDMMKHHKKELDQECIDTLDKFQSQKLREAFEKNFAKLKKPPENLRLPPKPPGL